MPLCLAEIFRETFSGGDKGLCKTDKRGEHEECCEADKRACGRGKGAPEAGKARRNRHGRAEEQGRKDNSFRAVPGHDLQDSRVAVENKRRSTSRVHRAGKEKGQRSEPERADANPERVTDGLLQYFV